MARIYIAVLLTLALATTVIGAPAKITSISQIVAGGDYDCTGMVLTSETVLFQNGVTLRNLTIKGVRNDIQNEHAALRLTGQDQTLIGCLSENNTGTGIAEVGATHCTIRSCTSRNNGTNGIGGSNGSDILVEDCDIYNNNRGVASPPWAGKPSTVNQNGLWFTDAAWEGGAGKWYNTLNLIFRNSRVHENGGPLWLDAYNKNFLVTANDVWGNVGTTARWEGQGITIEISDAGKIVNNYVHGNSGSAIAILESAGVTVEGNTLFGALEFRALTGRPRSLGANYITNNLISGATFFCSIGSALGKGITCAGNVFADKANFDAAVKNVGMNAATNKIGVVSTPGTPQPPPAVPTTQPGGSPTYSIDANGVISINGVPDSVTNGAQKLVGLDDGEYHKTFAGKWYGPNDGTPGKWPQVFNQDTIARLEAAAAEPTTKPTTKPSTKPTTEPDYAAQIAKLNSDIATKDGQILILKSQLAAAWAYIDQITSYKGGWPTPPNRP